LTVRNFIDSSGRVWVVDVSVATIKRVRTLTGINLLEVIQGELIEQLSSDPILLADCLYAVCQPQAVREGVSDEAFGQALAGDVIDRATTALLEGLIEFFPEPKRRLLEKATAKYRQVQTQALALVEAKLDSPELEAKILKDLEAELRLPEPSD
jgi:hypothetical protein